MLCLGDQIVGQVDGVGGVVGNDRDLARTGFRIDAHYAVDQALRGCNEHVAGAGDHVDRLEVVVTVGHQGHRLRAANGPRLVDTKQRTCGEDRRVRLTVKVCLRRGAHHHGLHARFLGRNRVHQHARRVHRLAAGHV